MKTHKADPKALKNPNDDSSGQCYAPRENGSVNEKKKKHFPQGTSPPQGWTKVLIWSSKTAHF